MYLRKGIERKKIPIDRHSSTKMDCTTTTSANEHLSMDTKTVQEHLLLDLIKEVCSEQESISARVKGKVNKIIADSDLSNYSGLHKLSTADEATSTVLGLMKQTTTELTYDEQVELNQAIIQKIQTKLPKFTAELERLQLNNTHKDSSKDKIKDLQESLDEKLKILEEQESEKSELMMQWLNHRLLDVVKFGGQSSEMLTLKSKILELKSKIIHLQILQNIFTETNQSIKAYHEVHKDLRESIRATEQRIKEYREIIEADIN